MSAPLCPSVLPPPRNRGALPVVPTGRGFYGGIEPIGGDPTMRTILVGTDTTAAADLAVEDAAKLARDRDADLVLLYVRPEGDLRSVVDPGKAADPDRHLAKLTERYPGVRATARVETRRPGGRTRGRGTDRGGPPHHRRPVGGEGARHGCRPRPDDHGDAGAVPGRTRLTGVTS